MNTYRKIAVSVMLFIALSIPSFGQATTIGGGGGTAVTPIAATPVITPAMPVGFAPALPITSQAVILAEAAKGIVKVTASVYGQGLVYGDKNSKTYTEMPYVPTVPNQTDFRELAQMVSMVDFQFEVRNPLDPININVAFRTKEGRSVFEGYQNFKLVKTADGSYTSSPIITVDMWPVSELWIDVPGADNVEVSLLNERGETTQNQGLQRDERTGRFQFNLYWAGQQNVLLTAYKYDGNNGTQKAVYSARTGTQQPIFARSVEPYAAVKDVLTYQPDTTVVELTVPALGTLVNQFVDRGVSPLVQVSFTKKGLMVLL